ncbi:hypothetical+protein [Methylocapsa aurea]|uniref:hypothetical protein n=1 Tax=Methylocapsa aurea TaxID=663610 RepID=UPI003D188CBE
MAKIKIAAEVDSGKFDEFHRSFDRFKSALDKMPDAWRATGEAAADAGDKFEKAASEMQEAASGMVELLENSRRLDKASESSARRWKDMATSTKNVATNIAKATGSLLKWAALTSVIGTLTSGGALFGLDHLAAAVSTDRTQSMGLGTTYGGLGAFRTQFGRLGDAEGILGRVSAALASPEGRSIFQQMGMSQGELNGDTADVATNAIVRMKETLDRTPKGQLGTGLQATRLDQLIDITTARVLQNMSREEVAGLAGGMGGLRKRLDLSPAQQATWQGFLTKLDAAGKIINSKFIDALSGMAGPIGNLATSFSRLLAVVMRKGGMLESFIGWVADGFEWLVEKLAPENEDSVRKALERWEGHVIHAARDIFKLGEVAVQLGNLLGWLVGVSPAAAATGPSGQGSGSAGGSTAPSASGRGSSGAASPGGATGSGMGAWGNVGSTQGSLTRLIEDEARRAGIDPRILEGIRAGESNRNNRYDVKDDAMESSWGPFQLNRRGGLGARFERETGLDLRNPATIPAQVRWVAQYLAHGGSLQPWMGYRGPRNADPSWGDSGYRPAPQANSQPVGPFAFARHTLAGRRVKVTVQNSTGASPVMLMNAAAAH